MYIHHQARLFFILILKINQLNGPEIENGITKIPHKKISKTETEKCWTLKQKIFLLSVRVETAYYFIQFKNILFLRSTFFSFAFAVLMRIVFLRIFWLYCFLALSHQFYFSCQLFHFYCVNIISMLCNKTSIVTAHTLTEVNGACS